MSAIVAPPTSAVTPTPMFHSRAHIGVGDLVILFMTRDILKAIIITPGEVFHNKFGRYTHDSLVGQKFGSKVHSPAPHAGYLYVLRPTPELWTLSLPHRTQILYTPDIAYITMRLNVRPGGRVLEAGTGSGSMTHSMSRSVGPSGSVLSYEFNEPRYIKAKEEFEGHGLRNVNLSHRNVCKDGFGQVDQVEAVFLDLPAPWEAIPHATKIMRSDIITRICCFSPCLEQVLRTVTTLRDEGYTDISTQEVLVRTHDIAQPPPTSSSQLSDISSIVERLKSHEARKEERRVLQMKTARERTVKMKEKEKEKSAAGRAAAEAEAVATAEQTKEAEAVAGVAQAEEAEAAKNADETIPAITGEKRAADEVDESSSKKPRLDTETINTDQSAKATDEPKPHPGRARDQAKIDQLQALLAYTPPTRPSLNWTEPEPYPSSIILTKPAAEMRGHTSYLTFATLHPLAIRTEVAPAAKSRVDALKSDAVAPSPTEGSGSEYGSEGLEEMMRTMTEEEMIALSAV